MTGPRRARADGGRGRPGAVRLLFVVVPSVLVLGAAWLPAVLAGEGAVPVAITGATRVEVDEAAGVWALEGSPVVVSRGDARVQAPSIRYEVRSQVVVASGGATYSDPSGQIRARTLTAWLAEQRLRAEGDVAAVAVGPPPVELQAARAEADRVRGVVSAAGGVVVRRSDLVLRAAEATYTQADQRVVAAGDPVVESAVGMLAGDRMEALLAEEVVVADGRVRFRYQDISGTAERAQVSRRDRVAVLSGRAAAQMGAHRISAEVLTVDLAARRVTASGAAHLTVAAPP